MRRLCVRYYAHYGSIGGFGRAARDYLAALATVPGVELEIVSLDHDTKSPEPRYQHLDGLVRHLDEVDNDDRTQDVAIYHAPPRVLETLINERGLEFGTTQAVAITTWETSEIPTSVIENGRLYEFDAVITPSWFSSDSFGAALGDGFFQKGGKVTVLPHCFDENFWKNLNVRDPDDTLRRFRFYAMGAWGERKNMLGVLKAYLHAFDHKDRVQLLMVLDQKAHDAGALDEIRSLVARTGLPPGELPNVVIPEPRVITEYELLALHNEADCFVSATRGEGWGLGMFEAAIMGKDVIAPLWGGQMDFLEGYPHHRNVPFHLTPCFGSEIRDRVTETTGQRLQVSRVEIPRGVNCKQQWAEPDLCVLAKQMRRVYEDGQKASFYLRDSSTARQAFEARFGYRIVGPQLANILRGIAWQTHSSSTSSP